MKPTKRRTLRHTCLRESLQIHIKQHGTSMQHTSVDKSPSDAAPSPMQKPNSGWPRWRSLRNHTICTIQAVDHVVLCNHALGCRHARQFLLQEITVERDKDSSMLVAVLWILPPSFSKIHSPCGSASCSFETVLVKTCELAQVLPVGHWICLDHLNLSLERCCCASQCVGDNICGALSGVETQALPGG